MAYTLPRPEPTEYNEYYHRYVALVPEGDIAVTLRDQLEVTLQLLQSVTPEQEVYLYAEGKWSLREVVAHLMDTERVFAFRSLTFAREGGGELPGMDQDAWVPASRAHDRPLADLIAEWIPLRQANVGLFASFSAEDGAQSGIASGNPVSVRAMAWIIAGHELWHRSLIERDYLGGGD